MSGFDSSIARLLLDTGAVSINVQNPFTYSSGIKSPIYCDNRLLITDVQQRKQVVNAFCEIIRPLQAKQIAGVATAGITWGAWIADQLKLPFVYVRPKPKGHGREKQIEGKFIREETILIEDLVSTGGSSVQALDAMRAENVPVKTLVAIFTYGFSSAEKLFDEKKIQLKTLSNLDRLLDEGMHQKIFDENAKSEVLRWRSSPENWIKD
ncbi:MAG: orotate phosphoribosyltransferase [Proteobacteria bacterium]|jgi:orotate phosphoribosyltransferase|nr:orotate phosphoribosyltransferase [Pseudomonadota bacterium]